MKKISVLTTDSANKIADMLKLNATEKTKNMEAMGNSLKTNKRVSFEAENQRLEVCTTELQKK